MDERRKFMRFDTILGLEYNMPTMDLQKRVSTVKNIGREGLCVVLDAQAQEGSTLDMSLNVPGSSAIFAEGKIVWIKECVGPPKKYDAGVKFTKIDSLDKSRLLSYVYNQWLKSKIR